MKVNRLKVDEDDDDEDNLEDNPLPLVATAELGSLLTYDNIVT